MLLRMQATVYESPMMSRQRKLVVGYSCGLRIRSYILSGIVVSSMQRNAPDMGSKTMIQPYLATCLLIGSTHLLHTHRIHFLGGPAVLAGSPSLPA